MKISTSVEKVMKGIKDTYAVKKEIGSPVVSGFPSLDKIITGFYPWSLTLIAGSIDTGETSFCLSVARNVALSQKKKVAIVSIQYSIRDITFFLLSQQGRIAIDKIYNCFLYKDEWPRLENASSEISKAHIFIYDYPFLTIERLWKISRNIVKENRIDLLIVDGFQHINNKFDHLWLLHRLINEIHIPIIFGINIPSQYRRKNFRPNLSDLKKWGIDNSHSENVIFLYQESICKFDLNRIVELIIYKGAQPPKKVKLEFIPEYMIFKETQSTPICKKFRL